MQLITPFYYANKNIQVVTGSEITVTNYTLFSNAIIKNYMNLILTYRKRAVYGNDMVYETDATTNYSQTTSG